MKKILFITTLTMSALLQAGDDSFITRTELGYIKTDGNTNTEAFNLDAKAKRKWEWHSLSMELDAQLARSNHSQTQSRYAAELNYDYEYSDVLSYGYIGAYKRDKFSGYDYQFYTGPDVKYRAIISEPENLTLELALLYAQEKLEVGGGDEYASYRLRGLYDYQLLQNLRFWQDLSFRGSFEDTQNYFIVSKTSLTSKISDMLSAGVSYRIDHSNIVPQDRKQTDRTFMVNLIMDYTAF
ncbi:MAG: putative salt-induced outer membrane protein [Campylobacterota bacterium]|nr:putative salt-induced outer membrane protein [Campylobacterota bacterium]